MAKQRVKLSKQVSECKHPNSRRTKSLAKKIKKQNNRDVKRTGHAVKANIIAQKLSWFCEKIETITNDCLTPTEFEQLIDLYLHRFDEELEQINMKQEIGKHRTTQHASRKDLLEMNIKRDRHDYETCGIELFNLCNPQEFKELKDWDGNSLNIQHMKFQRISKNFFNNFK